MHPLTLLLAYDGSAGAAAALGFAAKLFPGARVVVVTAHTATVLADQTALAAAQLGADPRTFEELTRAAEEQAAATAREGADLASRLGLAAEPQTAGGDGFSGAVLEAAERAGADVVVCGSRGHGGFSRAMLGSVSSSLLHHAHLPLLVVPEGAGEASGPLVIGYHESEGARDAIAVAGRLLAGRRAVVVNVWESPVRHTLAGRALLHQPIDELRELASDLDETFAAMALATAERGADLARQHGLEAEARAVESGSPAWRGLLGAARSADASLVVAGSRGRGAAASALFGSVSSGLVHNADLPVLIVRE